MRPLLVVLGLVVVASVLTTNVNALHCYHHVSNGKDSDWQDATCKEDYRYCLTASGTDGRVMRGCGNSEMCDEHHAGIVVTCCSEDFCNGDPLGPNVYPLDSNVPLSDSNARQADVGSATSASPVPLLIAALTSVIAAVGIKCNRRYPVVASRHAQTSFVNESSIPNLPFTHRL
ncbi:hypothetical protein AAVH_14453 [Aphelenchoides avenae]|nr:hypothetical protein AAVH_14453 [Aphelenchus avenae]